ncbi:MAG: uracil-DNA glycosylase [Candidatus Pacebacteria bacterium]|nr:uracil-DNA glycosylase [Candidatus Paceibacterota bacterium]
MADIQNIKIEPTWKRVLHKEFDKDYFQNLSAFVKKEYQNVISKGQDFAVYPKSDEIFRAFEMCPFDKVKVVIIGQDPYHGTTRTSDGKKIGQANGLCFAVESGANPPPSLKNIFKEIQSDIGQSACTSNLNCDLSHWAKQGVLLLNSTLTVQAGLPGSHQKKGWEEFTDAVIYELSNRREHIVFLLWGNYAKQKGAHIDRTKHLILETTHPSPFSVHNGFFGCKHFSKTNTYLRERGLEEIDWR